jgi:hypothetical protein
MYLVELFLFMYLVEFFLIMYLVCRALLILKKLIKIFRAHIAGRALASILLVELCLYLHICSRAVLVHVAS